MNDDGDVYVVEGGELPERSDYLILLPETINQTRIGSAHHELQIVNDDVRNIVDVNCVSHCLFEKKKKTIKNNY